MAAASVEHCLMRVSLFCHVHRRPREGPSWTSADNMSRDHLALMRHNLYLTSRTWGYRDFPRRAVRLISKDGAKKSPAACAIPMLRPVRIFLAVFAKANQGWRSFLLT